MTKFNASSRKNLTFKFNKMLKTPCIYRDTFTVPWVRYLQVRGIENGKNEPSFPDKYEVKERDDFYETISNLGNKA